MSPGIPETPVANNSLNIEVLGKAGYGSVNYERQFHTRGDIRFYLRAGLGTYNIYDFTGVFNPDIILPISLLVTYGIPHGIEAGTGNIFSSIVQTDTETWGPQRFNRSSAAFSFGYRYQKQEGGFVFRIGYKPVFEFFRSFVHWGGLSFGYTF